MEQNYQQKKNFFGKKEIYFYLFVKQMIRRKEN